MKVIVQFNYLIIKCLLGANESLIWTLSLFGNSSSGIPTGIRTWYYIQFWSYPIILNQVIVA